MRATPTDRGMAWLNSSARGAVMSLAGSSCGHRNTATLGIRAPNVMCRNEDYEIHAGEESMKATVLLPINGECMTPAEQVANNKPKRQPRNKRRPWNCVMTIERKRLGLTMREVADACGITAAAVCEIEHGTDPMLTTARKLATFCGATAEEMWPSRSDG